MLSAYSDYSLAAHNSFGFDVAAKFVLDIKSEEELPLALADARWCTLPYIVLGGGSNMVWTRDFMGLVLKVAILGKRLVECGQQGYLLEVGAGENWHDFVVWTLEQGWFGLENLALIPGLVGGAPIQNIGAYGVEMARFCHSVRAYDTWEKQVVELSAKQCQFAYRDSVFKKHNDRYIITYVRFQLPQQWQAQLGYAELAKVFESHSGVISPQDILRAVVALRTRKLPDPKILGNAGSFFKNPLVPISQGHALKTQFPQLPLYPHTQDSCKLAAGWLIEQCGFKGVRRGPVGVYEKQALVLVHFGGGNGPQLLNLAEEIQLEVVRRFGVRLEMEPRVI